MLSGYSDRTFAADVNGRPVSHTVYEKGDGLPVVVMQELPGIGVETLRLADELEAEGFRVVLPHLFGPIGRTSLLGNTARVLCMRREFRLLAKDRSSPVIQWLMALCRDVKERTGAAGVGTIGMCLTGNFAITLLADDSVLAGVASQPSMPIGRHEHLHMSSEEIVRVKARLDDLPPARALRFEGDPLCTEAKFDAYRDAFNDDGKERIRFATMPGGGHSVLTLDFVNEVGHPTRAALDEVIDYFREALSPESAQ